MKQLNNETIKVVFFGNTKYSVIGAKIIHEKIGIAQAVTLPDHVDKKNNPLPSPVKAFALQANIPVFETGKLTASDIAYVANLQPDFLLVEDYGLILPKTLLALPKYAPLNIHHSLLPKYRGPSPAPSAILAGETASGVSIIHMTEKVDAGDIYAQETYTVRADETTESLLTELNMRGGKLVVDVIHAIMQGIAIRKIQNEQAATFTTFMKKADGYIDLDNPPDPQQIDRMIRAYYPWPGVWGKFRVQNSEFRILKLLPGKRIQMEGKKPMNLKDFYNGYPELKPRLEKLLG